MRNIKKITIILIILTCVIVCVNTISLATIDIDPNDYDPTENGMTRKDKEKTGKIIGNILANIKVIGICIAVVMLTIIGLKYIICSVDEKATYKENMIPYVVGCFLLASATTIPSIVYDLVNK